MRAFRLLAPVALICTTLVAIDATPTDRIVPEDKRRNWVSDSKVLLELDSDHPLNFVQSEALKGFYKYDTDKNGKLEGDEIENAFGENAPALSRFQSEQGCLEDSEYVAAVAQFEKIDPPGMKLAQMFQATCQGDSNTFNAGWGKCPTYAKGYQGPGYKNHYWCPHDKSGGLSAQQVCPECGQCQPEQADKDNWDACGEPSGQCDGVCVAGVMDKIEAIPLVGAMVKKAREGACDAATLTSAAAHACNKATEYQDSGTICTLIGIVFGVDADGCEKILECITTFVDDTISNPRGIGQKHSTNTLGQCVDGFVDIIWGGIQKKLDLVQGAKDLAEQAPTDQELLNMVTPTIECPLTAENPIDKIVNAVKAIGQAIEALEDAMASVSDVLSQDPNNCKFSILVGLGVDFSFGPIAKGEEIGLYITLSKPDISSLLPQSGSSSRELDSKKMAAKLIKAALSGVEIGFYSASSFGYQTNLEVEAEAGLNYAVMLGDKSIWGGYGFELGLSVGLPNVGVGVELDMSLIFSAGNTDSSNNQIFRMIGFTFFLSLEVGVEVSPVSASIGCGLAATAELDFKNAIDQADKLQSSEIDWHNIGKSEQAKIFLPDDTCGDTGKAFTQSVENVQQQWESLKSNPNSAEHLMMEYEKCAEAVKCIGEGCKAEFEHYKNAAEETVKKCSNDISYSEECHSFVQDCSSGWQNSQGSTCLHCKKTSKGNCHTCYKTNPHGSCHSCEKTNPHGSCHSCQKSTSHKSCGSCPWWNLGCHVSCAWHTTTSWISNTACNGGNLVCKGWHATTAWVSDTACTGTNYACKGWHATTAWVSDTTCTGTNLACQGWEHVSEVVTDAACTGAEFACDVWNSVATCAGAITEDAHSCASWAGNAAATCSGHVIEQFVHNDNGNFGKCVGGVDECTTLIPEFLGGQSNHEGKWWLSLRQDEMQEKLNSHLNKDGSHKHPPLAVTAGLIESVPSGVVLHENASA